MNSATDYSMTKSIQSTQNNEISLNGKIEALLFVAPGAVGVSQLATALGVSNRTIEKALNELEQAYQNRGVRLQIGRAHV